VQCLHRWQKVLNPELVKGPWTPEVRTSCPVPAVIDCFVIVLFLLILKIISLIFARGVFRRMTRSWSW
jgi:hypothetical protein